MLPRISNRDSLPVISFVKFDAASFGKAGKHHTIWEGVGMWSHVLGCSKSKKTLKEGFTYGRCTSGFLLVANTSKPCFNAS